VCSARNKHNGESVAIKKVSNPTLVLDLVGRSSVVGPRPAYLAAPPPGCLGEGQAVGRLRVGAELMGGYVLSLGYQSVPEEDFDQAGAARAQVSCHR